MKVLMTGGGTGGHIYPAIAIADKIKKEHPDAEVLFVGTQRGLESRLVPDNGYDIEFINASGFNRRNMLANIKTAVDLFKGTMQTRKILDRFKPDVVIGTGGYVCGAVVREAHKKGIRAFIHEANAFPGVTNKMLEPHVEKVLLGFEKAGSYFKDPKKLVVVGNPVRASFFEMKKSEAREKLGIPEDEFMILSFGGSRGADRINEAMVYVSEKLAGAEKTQVFFGTGTVHFEEVHRELLTRMRTLPDNLHVLEYINDMDSHLVAADVVICRAGALSLAEVTACGKPAILIPSPNVTGNHQYHNAKAIADAGGAVLIEEKALTDKLLFDTLMELKNDRARLEKMGECSRSCAFPDSTQLIYDSIFTK